MMLKYEDDRINQKLITTLYAQTKNERYKDII